MASGIRAGGTESMELSGRTDCDSRGGDTKSAVTVPEVEAWRAGNDIGGGAVAHVLLRAGPVADSDDDETLPDMRASILVYIKGRL